MLEQPTKKEIGWTVAVAGPLAVITLYGFCIYTFRWRFPVWFLWIAVGLALSIGLVGLVDAVRSPRWRIVATIVYLPTAFFLILIYWAILACSVFNACP